MVSDFRPSLYYVPIANVHHTDVEVIMSVCGFPPQQYSPEKDSLASSINVQATRPTASTGSAKLNEASRSVWGANVGLAAGTAAFVIGVLTIL